MSMMGTSEQLMTQVQSLNVSEKIHARVAISKTHHIQLSDKRAMKDCYVQNELST